MLIVMVPGTVAASAGLQAGDRFVSAAGVHIGNSTDLIAVVRRQAPGTWLPLTVARGDDMIELVAKFPAMVDPTSENRTQHRD